MTRKNSIAWLLFIASLPRQAASTPRVRLWRNLKEMGAAILRDGVTLLPASDAHRTKLETIGDQILADGGTAWLLELPTQLPKTEGQMRSIFDRSVAYLELQAALSTLRAELPRLDEISARRRLRQVESNYGMISQIDFFPGEHQKRTRGVVEELNAQTNNRFSPQEPTAAKGEINRLDGRLYRGRLWATRQRLWIDRAASAWLIRRFIDTEARFAWLERPEDCPGDALGFDFGGATFTHIGDRVTFEVLLASFGLETDPGLIQLGRLVHYLDVGGTAVDEAAGFEAVLAGLRESTPDDDALLDAATPILDALHRHFSAVKIL